MLELCEPEGRYPHATRPVLIEELRDGAGVVVVERLSPTLQGHLRIRKENEHHPSVVIDTGLNVDCRNGAASAYDQTFTGAIGETFTLTNTNGSFACVVSSYSGVVTASGLNGSDEFQSTPATFTIVSSGQFYVNYNAGRANRSTITVVVIPAASSTQDSSPTPLLQQFGKSLAATCDDAQPDGLNWGGASSGGWGESWSQWMSGNAGGFVCTRTLVYNNLLGHWVVD